MGHSIADTNLVDGHVTSLMVYLHVQNRVASLFSPRLVVVNYREVRSIGTDGTVSNTSSLKGFEEIDRKSGLEGSEKIDEFNY